MNVGNILSLSFKYPFGDYKNLTIFSALFLLSVIMSVGFWIHNDILLKIGFVAVMLLFLIVPGYLISVIKEGCLESSNIPSLNIVKNIIDTLKLIVLNIVYMIIPILVFLALTFGTGLSSVFTTGSIPLNFFSSLSITLIISFIVFLIFTLISYVAMARFAYYGKLVGALNFKSVFGDIKKIGVLRLIGWYLLMAIILGIIGRVSLLLLLVPYIGIIIYMCLVTPIISLIFYYSIGLLYSNVAGAEFDINTFERELMEFRIHKK